MSNLIAKRIWWLGIFLGALYGLTLFDFSFIFGQSAHWTQPFGDTNTNFIGSLYFAQDKWRFPLFYVPQLAFPEGTNIIYTDSIPLLALIFKIYYKITNQWHNYFGFWIFLCFPLLGGFIALALKETECKDWFIIISGILLGLSCPTLILRYGHAGLMAQFLIVWSLFLYLRFLRDTALKKFTLQFMLVAALSIMLQSYFLFMTMPFLLAGLLQACKNKELKLSSALFSFLIVIAAIILVGFITGLLGSKSPEASTFGFGYYSMNILSPFLPPREHLPAFISNSIQWDGRGFTWDATGGQYEGHNYLGLGVIFLLLVCLSKPLIFSKQIIKNHLFLFLALCSLCLFALSTKIFLGNKLILNFPTTYKIFGYFRSSGRLFWPIYYVTVVAVVVFISNYFSSRVAKTIILLALILQLLDVQFFKNNTIQSENNGYPALLSHKDWDTIIAKHKFLVQFPSFQCGGWAGDWPENNSNMEALLLAAKQNKPTNSAYLARTSRNCIEELIQGPNLQIQPGGLYILGKKFPIEELSHSGILKKWCKSFNYGYICSQELASIPMLSHMSEFKPPSVTKVPEYKLGEVLHFVTNGNGESYFYRGWYGREAWGTWSMGKESQLYLTIPKSSNEKYRMTINARAFILPTNPGKQILVYLNNRKIALWEYHYGQVDINKDILFSKNILQKDGILNIKFVYNNIESPKQAGLSEDDRKLSFGLTDLVIRPVLKNRLQKT